MLNVLRWTALALPLALALPAVAADKDKAKDKKNDDQPATKQEYNQLEQAGEVSGKLAEVGDGGKTFTLRLEHQALEPNGNGNRGNRAAQNLYREQQQIMRTTNPVQRMMEMQRLAAQMERQQAQAARSAYRVITEHKDFDLQAAADAKVRFQDLPARFDEEGKPKQYTAEERKELKGPDPNLVGYKADFSDLKVGQVVKVVLGHPKQGDKEADKDQPKHPVRLIVIVQDAPDTPDKKSKKDKK